MKLQKYLCFFLLLLTISSCKKKDVSENANSNGGGGTGYPSLSVSAVFDGDAIFTLTKSFVNYGGVNYPEAYGATATFFEIAGDTSSKRSVGNLTLNNQTLFYDSVAKYYTSNNFSFSGIGNCTWLANDTGSFGNLHANNFYNVTSITNINFNGLDTVFKSSGFTISHANYYVDSVIYALVDAYGTQVVKKKGGQSTSVSFTASDLSSIDTTFGSTINIILIKTRAYSISSKKIYFTDASAVQFYTQVLP